MTVTSLGSISPAHHDQCHVSPTMLLRQPVTAVQLPAEQLEVYGKGQHLRGADAAFADQVLDELVGSLCLPHRQIEQCSMLPAMLCRSIVLRLQLMLDPACA